MDSYICSKYTYHTSKCSQNITCSHNLVLIVMILHSAGSHAVTCTLSQLSQFSQHWQFCIENIKKNCFHSIQCVDMSHFGLEHCHLQRYKLLQIYRILHSPVFKICPKRCIFFTYAQSNLFFDFFI